MFKNKVNTDKSGFTIVEILVSLFLVVAIVSMNYQLIVISGQTTSRAQRYLIADSVAFAKIQEYENLAFEDIPTGVIGSNYVVEDFTLDIQAETNNEITQGSGVVRSEPEPGSGSLIKVIVELNFPSVKGGNNQLIEYATYIQLGGVGR